MPHFIIDCSENIIIQTSPEEIMQAVYDTAKSTTLFDERDIKVRIHPFKYFNTANTKNDFIHVFAYMMQGRDTAQKNNLSKQIVSKLKELFPAVPVISMNVSDFEKATYCNKAMV